MSLLVHFDAVSLQRQLESHTLDQVSWGAKKEDGEITIYGTSDVVELDPQQLRELADTLEPYKMKLRIDKAGSKARLTAVE